MRQIYHFEDKIPPAVNEQMLRQELKGGERRRPQSFLLSAVFLS